MTEENLAAFVDAVKSEHRDLTARMLAIQSLLCEQGPAGAAAIGRLVELLTELHGRLKKHFAQEESGGYMEEALIHAPGLSGEARRLVDEHRDLLSSSAAVLAKAKKAVAPQDWPDLCRETEKLVKAIRQHETGETRVLMQGFNLDPEIIG